MSFKSLLLIAEGEQTRNGVDEHAIFSNGPLHVHHEIGPN